VADLTREISGARIRETEDLSVRPSAYRCDSMERGIGAQQVDGAGLRMAQTDRPLAYVVCGLGGRFIPCDVGDVLETAAVGDLVRRVEHPNERVAVVVPVPTVGVARPFIAGSDKLFGLIRHGSERLAGESCEEGEQTLRAIERRYETAVLGEAAATEEAVTPWRRAGRSDMEIAPFAGEMHRTVDLAPHVIDETGGEIGGDVEVWFVGDNPWCREPWPEPIAQGVVHALFFASSHLSGLRSMIHMAG